MISYRTHNLLARRLYDCSVLAATNHVHRFTLGCPRAAPEGPRRILYARFGRLETVMQRTRGSPALYNDALAQPMAKRPPSRHSIFFRNILYSTGRPDNQDR